MSKHPPFAVSVAALLAALVCAAPALAAFPGINGRLAYASPIEDTYPAGELYTANPDGSQRLTIASNTGIDDTFATWSPDGTRLAFVADSDGGIDEVYGNDAQIFTMNADGSDRLARTTLPAGARISSPSWSPDGYHIAYGLDQYYGDDTTVSTVWVLDVRTGASVRIDDGPHDRSPSWSPDGTRIAFARGIGKAKEIYTMTAAGTDARRLTRDQDEDDEPDWSPDGQRLAWASDLDATSEIWTMNAADGTDPKRLTKDSIIDRDPVYSPDGTSIAFWSFCRRNGGGCIGTDVWTLPTTGGKPKFVDLGSEASWDRVPDPPPTTGMPPTTGTGTSTGTGGTGGGGTGTGTGPGTPTSPGIGGVKGTSQSSKLGTARARSAVKAALRYRYGARFKQRKRLELQCERRSRATIACRVSWSTSSRRYAGKVVVRLRASGVKTAVDVERRK